ncbi:hypothetical protein, partial [Acinetobacter sp. LMB-5]|uniref:hypothetical protein n=1 Tax=Acinetobacter sp. LMB-5 TaxID=1609919 RepID=UPI000A7FE8A9
VWMSPLRTAQHFLSKLSDKIDGTSHELAASEYALGLINSKAQEALDAPRTEWILVDSGVLDFEFRNESLTKRGSVKTSYSPTSWQHGTNKYKIILNSGGVFETSDTDGAWWTAITKDIRDVTKWSGRGWVEFDVYTAASGVFDTGKHTAKITSWELYILKSTT